MRNTATKATINLLLLVGCVGCLVHAPLYVALIAFGLLFGVLLDDRA